MPHIDGKIRRNHTTVCELAETAIDLIRRNPEVSGISPGFIQAGKGVARGFRSVKIVDMTGGVLITVRQARTVQEVRIYSSNQHATKWTLSTGLRNRGIPIHFERKNRRAQH